jgi:hypothetical protein
MQLKEQKIEFINEKINRVKEIKDSSPNLTALDLDRLEYVIKRINELNENVLKEKKFKEDIPNQFFVAKTAVNRIFRDSGLDEVADIYNDLLVIAKDYMIE